MTGAEADALADHLSAKIDMQNGVGALLDCGDGTFAVSFARKSGFLVHATSADSAMVSSTIAKAETAGLLGRRLYAEKGTPGVLPYAANFVDVVLMVTASDGALSGVSAARILSALRPGGKAIIGRASAVSGGSLSTSALDSWLSSAGISGGQTGSDAQGVWAEFTKKIPVGLDEWTHRSHGPDNNPCSRDQLLEYPLLPQYFAQPHNVNWGHTSIVGGGRLYTTYRLHHGWDGGSGGLGVSSMEMLRARRVYNGETLWQRPLYKDDVNYPIDYSIMVADENYVYLAKDATVLVLDGETGSQARVIAPANIPAQIKWIGLEGNVLYMLAGPQDEWGGDESAKRADGRIGFGTRVVAFDLSSNTLLWNEDAGGLIDNREIGVSSGSAYYYVHGVAVVARNASTGAVRWSQTRQSLLDSLDAHHSLVPGQSGIIAELSGLLCSQEAIVISSIEDSSIIALSTANGDALWSIYRHKGRASHKVLVDSTVFNTSVKTYWGTDAPYRDGAVHVLTGQPVQEFGTLARSSGCGPFTACPSGLLTQCGGFSIDFGTLTSVDDPRYIKAPCSQGNIVSNGLSIKSVQACQCHAMYRGTVVRAPANGFEFDQTAIQSERLQIGPQGTGDVAGLAQDAGDWPTHRGNLQRTNSAGVTVATEVNKTAHFVPAAPYAPPRTAYEHNGHNVEITFIDEPEYLPTPPVAVGPYVYWGGADGMVRCYDLNTREQLWSSPTGGCIQATPTVAQGRVYVGSGDGWAYCFEATTGRLLWRFRGSPSDRRIMNFGHLISTWPVNTGVVVNDGKAIFGAGFMVPNGGHYYAVNAATGAIVWQNNSAGTAIDAEKRKGYTPNGYMTVHGGRLWARSYMNPNAMFNPSTGTLHPPVLTDARWNGDNKAREIGVIRSRFLYYGGRPQEWDQAQREAPGRKAWCALQEVDESGDPLYPVIYPYQKSCVPPAWDETAIALSVSSTEKLEVWNVTSFIDYFAQMRADTAAVYGGTSNGKAGVLTNPDIDLAQLRLWSDADLDMNGIVLSSNALVVTHKEGSTWKLTARNKTDGTLIWDETLPSEPLHQGIALNRNGDVIVMLCSGEMLCYGTGQQVSVVSLPEAIPQEVDAPTPAVVTNAFAENVTERHTPPSRSPGGATASDRGQSPLPSSEPVRVGAQSVLITEPTGTEVRNDERPLAEAVAECASNEWREESPEQVARALYEPKDMSWHPEQPCLPMASVEASSVDGAHGAGNVADRDLRTRWESNDDEGEQWLTVDMGTTCDVSGVSLVWYARDGGSGTMALEVSTDGKAFTACDNVGFDRRGMQSALRTFLPESARFVRVRIGGEAKASGLSILEVAVHGDEGELAAREER